jgi:tripartite-type tricarboxylate transporter receptor subunit TctC
MFDSLSSSLPQIKAGKFRALAMASARRSRILPDVPTVIESGVADFDVSVWYSILAAANTPPQIVQRLHSEFVRVLRTPDVKEKIESYGYDILGSNPSEADAFIRSEIVRWAKVVRDLGVTVN